MSDVVEVALRVAAVDIELNELFAEHVRYYDGALAYVFMGEVAEWMRRLASSGDETQTSRVRRVLDAIDAQLSLDDEGVYNLVVIGFLENLVGPDLRDHAVRAILPARLAAELRELERPNKGTAI